MRFSLRPCAENNGEMGEARGGGGEMIMKGGARSRDGARDCGAPSALNSGGAEAVDEIV